MSWDWPNQEKEEEQEQSYTPPTPKCPKCGSTDLWDDNQWEGCNKCSYTFGPGKWDG